MPGDRRADDGETCDGLTEAAVGHRTSRRSSVGRSPFASRLVTGIGASGAPVRAAANAGVHAGAEPGCDVAGGGELPIDGRRGACAESLFDTEPGDGGPDLAHDLVVRPTRVLGALVRLQEVDHVPELPCCPAEAAKRSVRSESGPTNASPAKTMRTLPGRT